MGFKKNKALHEEKFPASRKRKNMIRGQLKRFKSIIIALTPICSGTKSLLIADNLLNLFAVSEV